MDKRDAAAHVKWSKHQAMYGPTGRAKPTAGDEVVGCMKFVLWIPLTIGLIVLGWIVFGTVRNWFTG